MGKALQAVRKAPYVVALGMSIALVGSLGVASAATGGNFILGHTNKANAISVLKGTAGTPLSLVAPSGKAPLKVSNSVKIARLNADEVDGLHASTLGRTSSASGINASWSEDGRTVLKSVTIVAPRSGWVLLTGGFTASGGSGCSGFCDAILHFRDNTAGVETVTSGGDFNGRVYEPLSDATTIHVTAGSHTFQLIGSWFGTPAEPTWYDPSLTAIFLPFNGSGALG